MPRNFFLFTLDSQADLALAIDGTITRVEENEKNNSSPKI